MRTTDFPTSLDSLTNPNSTDAQNSPSHSTQHGNINDAMEAVQTKIGVDSSAVTTSHDYKLTPRLVTLTDAATISLDATTRGTYKVTLTATGRTLTISNATTGQRILLEVAQDGTGSRTITTYTGVTWAGGSAPTLTTTASKSDYLGFVCTGTNTFDGIVVAQNV